MILCCERFPVTDEVGRAPHRESLSAYPSLDRRSREVTRAGDSLRRSTADDEAMDTLFAQRLAEERSLQIEVAKFLRRILTGGKRRRLADALAKALETDLDS
jgi:hypothetical protein